MVTWWHNSPGYISINAQQSLLHISAASMPIPERSHHSVTVYYDTRYFVDHQPEKILPIEKSYIDENYY